MNQEDQQKQIQLQQQLMDLLSTKNTLALATISPENQTDIGLIPFLYHDKNFYIMISQLAAHTRNLEHNPNASLLIHLGDQSTKNPFTDQRVSFQVKVQVQENEDEKKHLLELMQEKLGKTVSLLTSLGDFTLMKLTPSKGTLVVGFGAAYDVDVNEFKLIHIDESKSKQIRKSIKS